MASKREAHLKQKSLRGLILLHTLKTSKQFFLQIFKWRIQEVRREPYIREHSLLCFIFWGVLSIPM